MPAPKGNKYYLLAENIGKKKLFETPQCLWNAYLEYKEWSKNNPFIEKIVQNGKIWDVERPRVLTMIGLAVYLGIDSKTFYNYGNNDSYKEYFQVYARITDDIYMDKFGKASCGLLKENIIARELGLVDKNSTELSGKVNVLNLGEGNKPE